MKRSIFVATLALTPSLLHAQAAQPALTPHQNVLQARATPPAALKSIVSKDPTSAATAAPLRVSTGVVAPEIRQTLQLSALPGEHNRIAGKEYTVLLNLVVDPAGKPGSLAIEQSAGNLLDREVLAAVSQYRFKPGTLDGEPYALPVRLRVIIQRGAQY